jgi:two-component system chemotaxis response regulator CheY
MLKLMVVDDSNIIRRKIQRCNLVSSNFDVVASASNGAEAVTMCKQSNPQVVTMDLTMPEVDGISCIEQLLQINEDILILVVSALSDKATGIEALEKGARGFLYKPFTEDDLVDALNELTEHIQ